LKAWKLTVTGCVPTSIKILKQIWGNLPAELHTAGGNRKNNAVRDMW